MYRLGRLHLIVGVGGIILFVLTGQYMDLVLDHLAGMPDGPRMLYRSAHIYILLTSMMNLVYGLGFRPVQPDWIQNISSMAIALAPGLMLLEFFCGATSVDEMRLYVVISTYSLVAVAVLMLWAHRRQKKAGTADKPE